MRTTQMSRFVSGLSIVGVLVLIAMGLNSWMKEGTAFDLENVIIHGNNLLSTDEIMQLLPVRQNQNITQVDLESIERELEKHPYIQSALVSRKFPSSLRIDLVERKPVAFLVGSRLFVVDEEGVLLPNHYHSALTGLPVITGIDAFREEIGKPLKTPQVLEAIELFNLIRAEDPDLYYRLSEIHFDSQKGFIAFFTDGQFPVLFGFEDFYRKARKLSAFLHQVEEEKRYSKLRHVDLRFREQVVAKFR